MGSTKIKHGEEPLNSIYKFMLNVASLDQTNNDEKSCHL